jgi:hypothetical protein
MRAKSLSFLLWTSLACLPDPPWPVGDETHAAEDSSDAWHEIDPPETATELDSSGPPSHEDGDSDAETGVTEDPALAELRILEVKFDPEGTDGAPESPELLRLVNLGPDPYPLQALRLEARSWPIIDANDLPKDVLSWSLDPGQRLLIVRFRGDSGISAGVAWVGEELEIRIIHDSGLRNANGAALTFTPTAESSDRVCWGEPSPPAPYDDPSHWTGPCPPTDGGALCRIDPEVDTNSAADWAPCPAASKKKPRR